MDAPEISLTVDNGDRIANVSNVLAAGAAYKMSNADQKLQMAGWYLAIQCSVCRGSPVVSVPSSENALTLVTGHVGTAQSLYSANNVAISEAFKAVGTLMASDATKKLTSDVLNVAKKVIGALDAVQGVHPFIGGIFNPS